MTPTDKAAQDWVERGYVRQNDWAVAAILEMLERKVWGR